LLHCRGYVRNLGLSANQVLHIPGAGDFQIGRIEGTPEPPAAGTASKGDSSRGRTAAGEAMDAEGPGLRMVVLPDEAMREEVIRENVPDPLVGEQTWPTDRVWEPYGICTF
jgi:pre-rRNA-processing protein TSR1